MVARVPASGIPQDLAIPTKSTVPTVWLACPPVSHSVRFQAFYAVKAASFEKR
jgi:hypothetical protein